MKNALRYIALPLIGLLLSVPMSATYAETAEAEATPWYRVSLVIFKHRNSHTGNEKWPAPDTLNLSFPNGILELEPAADSTKSEDEGIAATDQGVPFRNELSSSNKATDEEFQQALRSIQLSSNYEIMTSASWKQPALDKDEAIPVLIQAGDEFGGYYELEGSVTLAVSRYLHIKADLWLSDYIQQVEMIAPWWESPNTVTDSFVDDVQPYQDIDFSSQPSYTETVTRYESVRTVVLKESRRMRSGELHYLDNPMFGMLVRVEPYVAVTPEPDTLLDALPESTIKDASPVSQR